jgi:hypothetical protein
VRRSIGCVCGCTAACTAVLLNIVYCYDTRPLGGGTTVQHVLLSVTHHQIVLMLPAGTLVLYCLVGLFPTWGSLVLTLVMNACCLVGKLYIFHRKDVDAHVTLCLIGSKRL